ncbi:DUF7130 family rubredoxin-like protein [Halomarina ordinaria]|uniref:Rubredoxin-like domain-containing protein n=1 Tax=Halomarina ordinaria TaxID=3033939 RepID=A0ABD5U9V7_9EURY|nr:hypothetical protein [Halomarina sp. PSRA2]
MSGYGEKPTDTEEREAESLAVGQTLYTDDGIAVGHVRSFEEGGVFVTTREGATGLSVEHARSGHEFGSAELVWRCTTCGEMGEIRGGLPEECPNCGAEKEELMYWRED